MNAYYPVEEVPATPEYILAVIKEFHRQASQYDPEMEKDAHLTFDSTIHEWRDACDLIGWRSLGKSLNKFFKTDFSDEQWNGVLEPSKEKNLHHVCELLAKKAKRIEIKPYGNGCIEAGIFLTIRSLLKRSGCQQTIKPSTLTNPFFKKYLGQFVANEIGILEPGALPLVKIHMPFYHYSVGAYALGLVVLVVCGIVGYWSPRLLIFALCFTALAHTAIWIASRSRPQRVEFGSINTFRDLTLLIAKARKERLHGPCTS